MEGHKNIVDKLIKAGIDPLVKAHDGTIAENYRVEEPVESNLKVSDLFEEFPIDNDNEPVGIRLKFIQNLNFLF